MAADTLPPVSQVIQIGPLSTTIQQLQFLACLLSSYIFSYFYHRRLLHSRWPKLKHFYLASISHAYVLVCFSVPILFNIYLPVLFTYEMTKRYRDRRWMPVVVFLGVLGHLATAHIYRQFFEQDLSYHLIDQTAPLMMMIMKLTSYAWDVSDAYFAAVTERPRRSARTRRSSTTSSASGSPQQPINLSPQSNNSPSTKQASEKQQEDVQREKQLISLQRSASFLEFLGYAFLFPGFFCGPVISFYEYRCFIDGSYFDVVDHTKGALKGRKRRAIKQFLNALFFLVLYGAFKDSLDLKSSMTIEHQSFPVWYRWLYLHVANIIWRAKYYFVWCLAEGSYVMIGLGFRRTNHHHNRPRWDRCENVNLKRIELAANFKQLVSEWNVSTNQWLYAYVYKRVADWAYQDRRPGFGANLATYVVSAFWHVLLTFTILFYTVS